MKNKVVKKAGRPKSSKKVTKFKTDQAYFDCLFKIEAERQNKILSGVAVAYNETSDTNSDGVLDKELLMKNKKGKLVPEHKLIKKKRGPRTRTHVSYVEKKCTRCGSDTKITSDLLDTYCFDIKNNNSNKPFFVCNKCG